MCQRWCIYFTVTWYIWYLHVIRRTHIKYKMLHSVVLRRGYLKDFVQIHFFILWQIFGFNKMMKNTNLIISLRPMNNFPYRRRFNRTKRNNHIHCVQYKWTGGIRNFGKRKHKNGTQYLTKSLFRRVIYAIFVSVGFAFAVMYVNTYYCDIITIVVLRPNPNNSVSRSLSPS